MFKKPVAQFFIGEHYRLKKEAEDNITLRLQNEELMGQISNYKLIIENYKKDSLLSDSLVRIERKISETWKESYLTEKANSKKHKRRFTTAVIVVGAYLTTRLLIGLLSGD